MQLKELSYFFVCERINVQKSSYRAELAGWQKKNVSFYPPASFHEAEGSWGDRWAPGGDFVPSTIQTAFRLENLKKPFLRSAPAHTSLEQDATVLVSAFCPDTSNVNTIP